MCIQERGHPLARKRAVVRSGTIDLTKMDKAVTLGGRVWADKYGNKVK